MRLLFLSIGFLVAACGSGPPVWQLKAVPEDRDVRDAVLIETGRMIYRSLVEGNLRGLHVPSEHLPDLVDANTASRLERARQVYALGPQPEPRSYLAFRQNPFQGVCLQHARIEPPGSVLGLRAPAWVFDRILVIGGRQTRFAAWVEGTFVFTSEGFRALVLNRAENPRWEHADLELATCDLRAGR